ncbi:MAG: AbrB/MazE/SpoVT family DNA-binding domain-containing protein [Limnospira sp.]
MKTPIESDGQIKIPPEICQHLRLKEGDELLFIVVGNEIHLRPIERKRLSEFRGVLPATRPHPGKAEIRQTVAESLGINNLKSEG